MKIEKIATIGLLTVVTFGAFRHPSEHLPSSFPSSPMAWRNVGFRPEELIQNDDHNPVRSFEITADVNQVAMTAGATFGTQNNPFPFQMGDRAVFIVSTELSPV